jgi:hypothetical protein
MKAWFEIHGKDDHGPYSRWLGLDAKPVAWQGWLLTVVYYGVLVAIFAWHLPIITTGALAFASLLLTLVSWHLIVLWLASRRFATA